MPQSVLFCISALPPGTSEFADQFQPSAAEVALLKIIKLLNVH